MSRPTSRPRRRAAAGSAAPRRPAVCVLASGGLDSAVLLSEALRRFRTVQPIYVRAGLRWEKAELHALRRFLRTIRSPRLRPLVVLEMPMREVYGDHWSINGRVPGFHGTDASVYIPGRNIMLFAKAAAFCALRRLPILFLGILSANPFPDGSPEFLRAMERALARGLAAPIRLRAPFRRRTKDWVIRRGRGLPLGLTLSCSTPRRGLHCGVCVKCGERAKAFRRAGVPDPTVYADRRHLG
ncbi:MAG: 7-cyano-7-deazaguanine synthase [Acidobacteria bacterium]|nr:MAG: 7-cyano-7-deazaguanine synthase [Acidobacteriota bacterium]